MNKRDMIIYLVGFFDGEGNVDISERRHKYFRKRDSKWCESVSTALRLRISNTDKEVLDFIKENFDGKIYNRKRYYSHHKQAWIWHLSGKKASKLSKLMYPFSIVKKEKLKEAREFYDNSI